MDLRKFCVTVALSAVMSFGWSAADANGERTEIVTSQHSFLLTQVATGLEFPWGLDWLPNGQIIVTERPGRIRLVENGELSEPILGLPEIVSDFRDGLLDVAVSPDFNTDQTIYFAYSRFEDGLRWLEVVAARLVERSLENLTVVFAAEVKVASDQGFGSRIRFDAQGNLLITVGDHAAAENAQDPTNSLGSIVRITPNGMPAPTNPGDEFAPAVYAFGFKNPQGLAVHPETGAIWATDHGGLGGGELNKILWGGNYGWPTRSFSVGDRPGAEEPGPFIEPAFTWGGAPTVALSGLEIYTNDEFPNWTGDLFAGSLVQQALIRIMRNSAGAIVGTEYVLDGTIGRIRDVRQSPDGRLYVLNDDPDGGIYRIDPVL